MLIVRIEFFQLSGDSIPVGHKVHRNWNLFGASGFYNLREVVVRQVSEGLDGHKDRCQNPEVLAVLNQGSVGKAKKYCVFLDSIGYGIKPCSKLGKLPGVPSKFPIHAVNNDTDLKKYCPDN